MKHFRIISLPGDGIGPEVTEQAERVLAAVGARFSLAFDIEHHDIGAAAVAASGAPLPADTVAALPDADAVLLGAVGDPRLDSAPRHLRPETALLALRSRLEVHSNLRPVQPHPALAHASPLRPERLQGVDLLVVRELTGGLYYGEPRGRYGSRAVNTLTYETVEIERVARVALLAARGRRGRVTSVDKANVLEVSQLWREVVTRLALDEFPDVALDHLYVDYAAMRLVSDPASIDVLLTENLFGDILSDEAGVLVGSLGLLPSASLGDGPGLFEPIHGSAPLLAGRDLANPIGAIASAAMLLRHGLGLDEAADAVDGAIAAALAGGARTADIAAPGDVVLGTRAMAARVVAHVEERQPAEAAG
jgi:3-isopropylmalate dehydrogenase